MSTTPPEAQALDAELLTALVRALHREWESVNYSYFRGALLPPLIHLSDAESRLGRWIPDTRTIEISRRPVLDHPWGVVTEVLKHEVAHQYVHEVLGARVQAEGETAHGESFRAVCVHLGIDPRSSGLPRAAGQSADESRVPRLIAKLLALAESPNQHEAEAAMREAQRLLLKYNLDQARAHRTAADLRDAQAGEAGRSGARPAGEGRREPENPALRYGFRHLGEPAGRLQPHDHHLGAILGRFFFVEAIWVRVYRPLLGATGTVLEVCGTESNLEIASYVREFLLGTGERLWAEHKRRQGITLDRDRRSFLTGVMRGFYQKLEAEEQLQKREGLVWVPDATLRTYYERRHPRRRTVQSTARHERDAFAEGQAAGRNIVLHKPIPDSRAGGESARALGSARPELPGRRSRHD